MSYFAKLDSDKVITSVVVAAAIDDCGPGDWLQVFMGDSHPKRQGKKGWVYNADLDAIVGPKPFPSWTINTDNYSWQAPVSEPADAELVDYFWDETSGSWVAE